MEWYEATITIIGIAFGVYLVIWAVPGTIMSAMIALGNIERIIYIDKQLAKNLDKYYDEKGYLRWEYQISSSIGTRLFGYWISYPFIKHRAKTPSRKFQFFMWVNCLGMWSFLGAVLFVGLAKLLGVIP
ncbi:hypothetical protein [Enterovibrio norvegicus]|uniref:Uncharacterized protein n=1 Tax=Enterovibrio norvegicus DSM 15893 TaxID=1121869 RepID=A0A1I5TE49_9GAMM|nr:hypothetical protein [Enterovibrio norvegicus]SFP81091.1 hypothetical protein SAMN03084138_03189 [Enterovibrio norvegicus DSM 15893]